jgi:hypothetical protein
VIAGRPLTLTGQWQSRGYQCPAGVYHQEVVDVVQRGVHVVATKVVGDDCVSSGHRTFQGTVFGMHGRVDGWLGSPGLTPAIGVRDAPLTVIGPNRFTVTMAGESLVYTRASSRDNPHWRPPWWLWIVLASLAAVATGLSAASRRSSSRHQP